MMTMTDVHGEEPSLESQGDLPSESLPDRDEFARPGPNLLQKWEKNLARLPLARVAAGAVPRTVTWAIKTVTSDRDGIPGPDQISMSAALMAQVAMDESLVALAAGPSRFPRRADYERVSAELDDALALFTERGWIDNPHSYHLDPPPLALREVKSRFGWAVGQRYERISWESGYEVHEGVPGSERWMGFEANRTASAWVLDHRDGPRPWLLAIHGFGTGAPFADMFTFRAQHLHNELGWNVAAIVLPVHGNRRPSKLSGEEFLGIDMMNAVHGMSQALWDIRRLASWIRLQNPTSLALHGVSLGGYMTSLTACFEDDFDVVIAGIPVADFPDLFRRHSPKHVAERAEQHGIVKGKGNVVHRVVSPLVLEPVVPKDRLKIFAGVGDRMAVPEHAKALWSHWDEPEICWFPGNHVGYLWSNEVAAFIDAKLAESISDKSQHI